MKTKSFRKVMGAVLAFALVVTGLKFGEIKAEAGDPVEGDLTRVVEDYSVTTAKSTDKKVKVTKSVDFSGENNVVINFDIEADESLLGKEQSKGDVVLVIDASGTLNKGDSYKCEKAGAKQIAKMVIENGFSVGVVSFEATADIMCNPSKDYDTVAAAIDKITCTADSPHFTNMQAGLHVADVMLGEDRTEGGTIIVLSDGKVNQCYRPYSFPIIDIPKDRFNRTKDGRRVKIYNCMRGSEDYYSVDKDLVIASGFKYINPMIINAYDANVGSTYTQATYLDAEEHAYSFSTNTFKTVVKDGAYYKLNDEYKNNYPYKRDTVIKCKKYVKNDNGEYETDGVDIELTKWIFPGDAINYCTNKLPNKAFNPNIQDCGFMTISEAQLIKDKGTTIYTVTYPNMNNPVKKTDYEEAGKTCYEKYVMTNVCTTEVANNVTNHYNQFVELGENISWDGVVKGIKSVLPADDDQPTSEDFSVDLTDELPAYLTPAASTDGAYKVDGKVVTAKVSDFDEDGHATLSITAALDKEAMIAAYRANTSIGKVSADASKIWIDMNKAASVAYGTETINVPNPKLPFGIWNVNVEYQVEVPDSTGFNTEYKVVTAPAVQLFETETYTIKNVDGYDVTNQAKFKEPFVITTYSKGVDVVSPSDNKVKNSIGSEVDFDGESRNVYVFVGYELQSYTVSFYNENGDGIIEKLIPSVEPVIPVADAPVDPQPAEGQQEESQQDGEPQENGERVILIPVGEITRDPEITSKPAIVTPDSQVAADEQPTAPVEGTNGEEDEEEGFPEIPSSFITEYNVFEVQVKYGVRISDGSMSEANFYANKRAEGLADDRHANVHFAGWTHADKTSAGTALIAPITGDLNVYASYTSEDVFFVTYKQYDTVPFDTVSNYGDPVRVVSGGSHTVLTTGPALSGYEFKGWSLSDAEDATVLDVNVIENITADVVLYPVYEKLPDPEPVDPTPVDPTPVDPTPVDPTPVDPTPVDPTPVDPTPVDPTPVNPAPSYPNPTPVNPEPAKQPELDMGTEGTPLGDTNVKEPQVITYEGEPESELPDMEILDDGQALGDAVLPKTGTMPVPVFYVTGGFLAALAGILFFVKKRH